MSVRALPDAKLLEIWEQGQHQQPAERALALIAATDSCGTSEEPARWSVGRRDGFLLTLREHTFGTRVEGTAVCPHCREHMDLTFSTAEIRVTAPANETEQRTTLRLAACDVQVRLPDSTDLLAVGRLQDAGDALQILLRRCVTGAAPEELSAETVEAIEHWMSEADPQACVTLALQCSGCAHAWIASFDILAFFWHELQAWAMRLTREVHTLASAYHWSQADILALTPWRRQCYLQMVNG